MVLVQKWPFFQLFFLANMGQENVFYVIIERKNVFLGYKNKKFKNSKNWHFSKVVSPWFWCKIGHFSTFVFSGNLAQENVFYDILKRKNAFLDYKNKKFTESKNWHFSKGVNIWFWSQNGYFSNIFLVNKVQENAFYVILERKNAFLGYKNQQFKKLKNWHFSKGVNPWFSAKNGHFFQLFFSGNIAQENVFYVVLERKNAFLGYKNKKFKKSKNWLFSKGVNSWFWSKNGHFSNFFFLGSIGQENNLYDILERKNAFLGYKKKSPKSRKIDIFPKGLTYGFGPKMVIFQTHFI